MDPFGPIVVVVGNPAGAGRTGSVAQLVADRLGALGSGVSGSTADGATELIDLAIEPAELLGWGSPLVAARKEQVLGARALVIASPTYKAAYTGLLKLFLDQFGAGELAGVPTVAVMTGGSAHHALAVDVHLAPVLVEIGASLPTRGLYVFGPDVDEPTSAVEAWWAAAEGPLTRALSAAGER